jgi:hypothetical protein
MHCEQGGEPERRIGRFPKSKSLGRRRVTPVVRRGGDSPMKSPFQAFTLSFFLPGAGLWYLGKWAWGFVNLAVVLVIGVIAALALGEEAFLKYILMIACGCGGGSGGLAMALAQQMNQKTMTGGSCPPRQNGNAEQDEGERG